MIQRIEYPLRVAGRSLWLGWELLWAAIDYSARCAFYSNGLLQRARANWLQRASRRILKVFDVEVETSGPLPSKGLLVCNHLGYLDILVLGSLSPSVFVAKSEVRKWPVFGWFARLAGTIFVNRNSRSQARDSADEIDARLRKGALVILFPEGTSSGGETVLPFKSSLLEPATRQEDSLTAAHISYRLADGDVSEEVCYWKDMTLVPHLMNLLSKRDVGAVVGLAEVRPGVSNRKELAQKLHGEVLRLKESDLCARGMSLKGKIVLSQASLQGAEG